MSYLASKFVSPYLKTLYVPIYKTPYVPLHICESNLRNPICKFVSPIYEAL